MNEPSKPRMSGFLWAMSLAVALGLDGVQGLLSAFGVGLIVNRIVNPVIAGGWYLFFRFNGITYIKKGSLQKGRIVMVGGIFLIEESGIGDFLPGWTTQVAMTYFNEKADALTSKMEDVGEMFGTMREALKKKRRQGNATKQQESRPEVEEFDMLDEELAAIH